MTKFRSSGFSLVQISILLLAASLIMVTILPSVQKNGEANRVTTERMNELIKYFRAYMVANGGALPCPADATKPLDDANYGVAAANPGSSTDCSGGTPTANSVDAANNVAIGMVPVKTMGIPPEYALDAWGRNITYVVDTGVTLGCWASPATGAITVTDNGAANKTIIALVSHGANGHGAYIPRAGASGTAVRLNNYSADSDELTNAHVDSSFAATSTLTAFTKKALTSTFDDNVVYSSQLWYMNNIPLAGKNLISSVTAPSTGYYYSFTNSTISLTVNYGNAVTVTGTPRLALGGTVVGGVAISLNGGSTGYANYASGSGTSALVFNYTVQGTDATPNGLTVTSPIDLNGGNLGGACTDFTPPSLAAVIIPRVAYLTKVITTWTVPADWNNSYNKIEALGSGGNGGTGSNARGGGGGGGGAYNALTNYSTTAGNVMAVQIGGGGGTSATQFKNATTLIADYGRSGSLGTRGNGGDSYFNNYPQNAGYSGGAGGQVSGSLQSAGGGGGGAAGPNGAGWYAGTGANARGGGGGGGGANGGGGSSGISGTPGTTTGNGGAAGKGSQGTGGAAGSAGSTTLDTLTAGSSTSGTGGGGGGSGGTNGANKTSGNGGNGSMDGNSTWGSTYGPGGGGGGAGGTNSGTGLTGNGGNGGGYGAGGGGIGGNGGGASSPVSGIGGDGLLVITYR